jgi:hypothetical protein
MSGIIWALSALVTVVMYDNWSKKSNFNRKYMGAGIDYPYRMAMMLVFLAVGPPGPIFMTVELWYMRKKRTAKLTPS